jgi:hypothetical protein
VVAPAEQPEPLPDTDSHQAERMLVPAGRSEPPQFHDPLLARARS